MKTKIGRKKYIFITWQLKINPIRNSTKRLGTSHSIKVLTRNFDCVLCNLIWPFHIEFYACLTKNVWLWPSSEISIKCVLWIFGILQKRFCANFWLLLSHFRSKARTLINREQVPKLADILRKTFSFLHWHHLQGFAFGSLNQSTL